MNTNKLYFTFYLLITLPIAVGCGVANWATLNIMQRYFKGYPEMVYVGSYTPDGFLQTMHISGYPLVIGIFVLMLLLIASFTFFIKFKVSNKINFTIFTATTLFFAFSTFWFLPPILVLAR